MEKDIVEAYKAGITLKNIEEKFKLSKFKIERLLIKHSLLNKKEKKDWTNIAGKIVELYNKGLSISKIEKELFVSHGKIAEILHKQGIILRTNYEYNKKYFFNEDYFEIVDTEQKAYFLGLLYADGNVCIKNKRKRVQITLQNEDAYIIQSFCDAIGYKGNLYNDRGKYSKIILYSDKMAEDLIKIGCTPVKSLTLQFPDRHKLPEEFQRHFIRGYFDGDGCVTVNKTGSYIYSFTSTESFTDSLRVILKQYNIDISPFQRRYKDNINSAGSAYLRGKNVTLKFYEYLYKNASVYLNRKHDKIKIKYVKIIEQEVHSRGY